MCRSRVREGEGGGILSMTVRELSENPKSGWNRKEVSGNKNGRGRVREGAS